MFVMIPVRTYESYDYTAEEYEIEPVEYILNWNHIVMISHHDDPNHCIIKMSDGTSLTVARPLNQMAELAKRVA